MVQGRQLASDFFLECFVDDVQVAVDEQDNAMLPLNLFEQGSDVGVAFIAVADRDQLIAGKWEVGHDEMLSLRTVFVPRQHRRKKPQAVKLGAV